MSPKTIRKYNSSAMYFLRPGIRSEVWDRFDPSVMEDYRGDQDWIANCLPDEQTIPQSWIQLMEDCPNEPSVAAKLILCNVVKNEDAVKRYPWVREVWK